MRKLRKYEDTWKRLQTDRHFIITLPTSGLTNLQKNRQLRTIRKAVIKEKYIDHNFKRHYPNAELTSEIDNIKGTLELTLTIDVMDVSHLF